MSYRTQMNSVLIQSTLLKIPNLCTLYLCHQKNPKNQQKNEVFLKRDKMPPWPLLLEKRNIVFSTLIILFFASINSSIYFKCYSAFLVKNNAPRCYTHSTHSCFSLSLFSVGLLMLSGVALILLTSLHFLLISEELHGTTSCLTAVGHYSRLRTHSVAHTLYLIQVNKCTHQNYRSIYMHASLTRKAKAMNRKCMPIITL